MEAGPRFSTLLAQPEPSEAPAQPSAAGGVMLNDEVKQIALQNPYHLARVAVETSREALKRMAQKTAQGQNRGF